MFKRIAPRNLLSSPVPLIAVGGLIIVASGILLATGGVSAQEHRHPTRPDSFSYIQVDTTDELVRMIQKNPQLRKNYARHFGIPEGEVMRFVKEALVPSKLTKAQKVTTFGIRKNGKIYPVTKTIPAGTKVWATRSGTPVLKWICSNPIGYKMPGTRMPKATLAEPTMASSYSLASLGAGEIEVEMEPEIAPELVAMDIPEIPEQPVVVAAVPPTPVEAPIVPIAARNAVVSRGGTSTLALLPLAAVAVAVTKSKSNDIVTPIPEPSTIALLALTSVAGLAVLKRRK